MAKKLLRQLRGFCKTKGRNSWHRCMIMEGHGLSAEGKATASAQASYDHAIGAAIRSGHIHDAGLGAQLAAEYFLEGDDFRGNPVLSKAKDQIIRQYLEQARDHYTEWGAMGLVQHLEQLHSTYLRPISIAECSEQPVTEVISTSGPSFQSFGDMNLIQSQEQIKTATPPRIIDDTPGTDVQGNEEHEEKEELSLLTDAWRDSTSSVNPHTSEGDFPSLVNPA